ncbi:hypothetical protein BDZ94DRAFT_1262911 [Collybia nuda]|uniref:Ricin B lectin domain-containing protein n=1 Tax=Collybia nuda TaxID=64659 RepID=A0A9P5Y3T0_9AGAR|nr:hypothetical protein BDZ94DRAFT_1262911 [Collybia nuda]
MSPLKTLCSLVVLASSLVTAASLEQGSYLIVSNLRPGNTVRSYTFGTPIFVTLTRENPGPFQEWKVGSVPNSPENSITLENVGLKAYAALDPLDNIISNSVVTSRAKQVFTLRDTGKNGTYNIVVPGSQKMWTVSNSFPREDVKIEEATGSEGQEWKFLRSGN